MCIRDRSTGAYVPQEALEPLGIYLEMLCQWNKAMNLVGPHSWQNTVSYTHLDVYKRQLYDTSRV